jgi:electron transport complex protein RnfG
MESSMEEKQSRFQNNYIFQAWLCIILAFVFGASLAGVQAALGPVIAENKVNETKAKVPELLLGADSVSGSKSLDISVHTMKVEKNDTTKMYTVYEAKFADGTPAGWVTKVAGQGYADRIELLLGLTPRAEKITGLFILDQKETPGLGNKIVEPKWRQQFTQKGTDAALRVVKGGAKSPEEIDAVTGATISSDSVVSLINKTIADLKHPLSTGINTKKE